MDNNASRILFRASELSVLYGGLSLSPNGVALNENQSYLVKGPKGLHQAALGLEGKSP